MKNSGKPSHASYLDRMDDLDVLANLPNDERIRSRKLAAGVATLIVDATDRPIALGTPGRTGSSLSIQLTSIVTPQSP